MRAHAKTYYQHRSVSDQLTLTACDSSAHSLAIACMLSSETDPNLISRVSGEPAAIALITPCVNSASRTSALNRALIPLTRSAHPASLSRDRSSHPITRCVYALSCPLSEVMVCDDVRAQSDRRATISGEQI